MGKFIKRISILVVVAMFVPILQTFVAIDANADSPSEVIQKYNRLMDLVKDTVNNTTDGTYSEYLNQYGASESPDAEILIPADDFVSNNGAETEKASEFNGQADVLKWNNRTGSVTWKFIVKKAGNYNLEFMYYPLESNDVRSEFAVKIDGAVPFKEANNIVLEHLFKSKLDQNGKIIKNEMGNEIKPKQIPAPDWTTTYGLDQEGLYNSPFKFYLSKGEHEIELVSERASVALKYLKFCNPPAVKTYEEYLDATKSVSAPAFSNKIEGEYAFRTSDIAITPSYDRSSYLTSPNDPTKIRYNSIGAGSWEQSGQWIEWKFDVPEAGYYKLGARVRQDKLRGISVNRDIYINGVIPFDSFKEVKFPFSSQWYFKSFGGEKDNFVYLNKGTNTVRMKATTGAIGQTMLRLSNVIYVLNTYVQKIRMITGSKPDSFNDYYIETQIPEIVDVFNSLADELVAEKDQIESTIGTKGSEAAALETLARLLRNCAKDTDKIPTSLTAFLDYSTSISSWIISTRRQPLEIDYIEIVSADSEFSDCNENFFEGLLFGIKSFFGSFFTDYDSLSANNKKSAINVWVAAGVDQAQIVKDLISSDFTSQYGTEVNISLVQGSILEAALAGKGPDVALFVGTVGANGSYGAGDVFINLASRGALCDLRQFEGFNEAAAKYPESALTTYTYNQGVYALPLTRFFPMMFYRTDILNDMGVQPPETWDDLISTMKILKSRYMDISLPIPTNQISTVVGAGEPFATMLLQQDMNYFNDDLTKTVFDRPEAIEAFTKWTEFYTLYSQPLIYSFYQRFRLGEMPLGLENYGFYTQLDMTAPEIKGLWEMTLIPGTRRSDGTIDRSTNSNGTGAIILSSAKEKEKAWEFVKWFSRTDIQAEFGRQTEILMGPMGRYQSADPAVIKQLPWSQSELDLILEQMTMLKEVPPIPAAYAVTRGVSNAFRKVVNNFENPKQTMFLYSESINQEITRKNKILSK